jgi:hypothetical protein
MPSKMLNIAITIVHKSREGIINTPPNSLIDSNACSKMKTKEEKRIGVHFFTCNTSRVGGVLEL